MKNTFRKLTSLNIYFYHKTSWDEYAYKNLKEENAIERREERIWYLWWKILIIRLELHETVRCLCNTYIVFSLSSFINRGKNLPLFFGRFPVKGHDPNSWFSGITFFSGLALCSLQIKKWSLMGCLFFDADFSTFFHFGR